MTLKVSLLTRSLYVPSATLIGVLRRWVTGCFSTATDDRFIAHMLQPSSSNPVDIFIIFL